MTTCLIVDDSAVIRKVARRLTESLSLVTEEAETAEQALAICRGVMPNVILVDATMPGMDGFEFARELRRLPDGGKARVIISTVEHDLATVARVLHVGADAYLGKPFNTGHVRQKLEEVGILAPAGEAEAA